MKLRRFSWLVALVMSATSLMKAQDKECIQNPVLPGFHPDPCAVSVGGDYYIVNSTFEWFPGIPIYHSTDLINWEQVGNVLTRKSQLDLTGCGDSKGIYAPSITYHKGLFYVTYTVVQIGLSWPLQIYPNYIVTAKDPRGPWSEPVLVDALGFDPYFFIDDDDKAYIVVRVFDHRKGKSMSPGIGLHEVDLKTLKPIGEPKFIYSGWTKRSAEGPKLLKKDGYYYLFTAEGGTGYGHYEGVARSRNIWGPYERAPRMIYTARDCPDAPIQKAGHGTFFNTPDGEWYTTHLGSRPLTERGNCPLGRETCVQKIEWNAEGWPELASGDSVPALTVEAPKNRRTMSGSRWEGNDDFSAKQLDFKYCTLREPFSSDWLRHDPDKGILSLRGRAALGGLYRESMVAQRVTSFNQLFETKMKFNPTNFRHSAGLCCYYNSRHFYALGLTYDEEQGLSLELWGADKKYMEFLPERIRIDSPSIYMRMHILKDKVQFYYSLDNKKWHSIGPALDFSKISDDYAGGYTGAMAALFAQDLMYENLWADFDYFNVTTND